MASDKTKSTMVRINAFSLLNMNKLTLSLINICVIDQPDIVQVDFFFFLFSSFVCLIFLDFFLANNFETHYIFLRCEFLQDVFKLTWIMPNYLLVFITK